MSEMIEEVLVDHIPDVAPTYPLERVQFMFEKFPDSDVYIECKGCTPYLLVRVSDRSYSFFGPYEESEFYPSSMMSEASWECFLKRSYKIIRDTGVIPYAHRS